MAVLMSSDGSKTLNGTYWKQKCKEVPTDATMILLEITLTLTRTRTLALTLTITIILTITLTLTGSD